MSGGPRLGTDAARWLARRQVRARRTALVTLALVVALGATASLLAAGAADRTARAYGHYVESAEVGDVVVNPSLATTEVDRLIRDLPGVRSVTTDALLLATLGDGAPSTPAELTGRDVGLQVRGSTDGRYRTMDRPALAAGRMATGTGEVTVTAEPPVARASRWATRCRTSPPGTTAWRTSPRRTPPWRRRSRPSPRPAARRPTATGPSPSPTTAPRSRRPSTPSSGASTPSTSACLR